MRLTAYETDVSWIYETCYTMLYIPIIWTESVYVIASVE